jgi:hypothetical protein
MVAIAASVSNLQVSPEFSAGRFILGNPLHPKTLQEE